MTLKKKIVTSFFAITMTAAIVFALSSCQLMNKLFPCKHTDTITDVGTPPTCTESGISDGSHCAKCGEVIKNQTTLAPLGHTEVVTGGITPTCTTTGLTEGKSCSVCNTVIVPQAVIPPTHNYGNWTVLTESTCFFEGEKTRTCTICSTKENKNIETLEHSFVQNEETKLFSCEHCDAIIYAGHLYAAFEVSLNWYDAYKMCDSFGGHLVTITSESEQNLITDLVNSRVLPNVSTYYYWTGGLLNGSKWIWTTGEELSYTHWGRKEPDYTNYQWHIAISTKLIQSHNSHIKPGDWEDIEHYVSQGFICEWELDIVENMHFFTEWQTLSKADCFADGKQYRICTHCGLEEIEAIAQLEHNFIFSEAKGVTSCEYCNAAIYDGRIYKIFTEQLSWFDAYSYCEKLGGHLLTITSEDEQAFVENYMNSQSYSARAWIGAYNDGAKWQWITGEMFEYTNWNKGEPSGDGGTAFFAEINFDIFGEWNDLPPHILVNFICEWEAE